MIKYPVGLSSFREIRKGGFLYIDKAMYIHELVSTGKYFFLSRPRRFGKSMLISTMDSYDPEDGEYTLGYPNIEVRNGFFKNLMHAVQGGDSVEPQNFIRLLKRMILEGISTDG